MRKNDMKRILVLGASGMAGHVIALYLKKSGYDVTALSTSNFPYTKSIICDVMKEETFKQIIIDGNFEVVINCIGILNINAENNKDRAVYLNSYIPHLLVSLGSKLNFKIIHISTDCVFSGEKDYYVENSFRDGIKFYDRTKALGEIVDERNLTFRTSIIGPDIKKNGIGLFNWFMNQKNDIKGYDGVKWTGVTTITLAKAIENAIKSNLTGIYNLVNNKHITKYNLLQLCKKVFNKNITIFKDDEYTVSKILINTRQDCFSYIVPQYDEMICEMYEWIYDNYELYPHYEILEKKNEET